MLPKLNFSLLALTVLLSIPGAELVGRSPHAAIATTPELAAWSDQLAQASGDAATVVVTGERNAGLVAVSPDGETLISVRQSNAIQRWDREGNALGDPVQGHGAAITTFMVSPDGAAIASGSVDGTLRLYDAEGNPLGDAFLANEGGVTGLAFSPDSAMIATTGADGTVRLWDLQGNPQLDPIQAHLLGGTSVAIAPDGETLISSGSDGAVLLWDLEGNRLDAMQRRTVPVNAVAINPEGVIATGNQDGALLLWRYDEDEEIYLGQSLEGHDTAITAMSFSPDGTAIATADANGTVRQWDLEGNAIGEPIPSELGAIAGMAYVSDDVLAIANESGTVQLLNTDGTPIGQPFGGSAPATNNNDLIWLLILLPIAGLGLLLWWWQQRRPQAVVETSNQGGSERPSPTPTTEPTPSSASPASTTQPRTRVNRARISSVLDQLDSSEPLKSMDLSDLVKDQPKDQAEAESSDPPTTSQPGEEQPEESFLAARTESIVAADRLAISGSPFSGRSHLSIEPQEGQIFAQWDIPDVDRAVVEHQGGGRFAVRLHDVTGIDLEQQTAHNTQEIDCDEHSGACLLPVPAPDRDYLAEIGYHKPDGTWLPLTRSTHLHLSSEANAPSAMSAAAIGAALGAAAFSEEDDRVQATIEAAKYDVGQTDLSAEALADVDANLEELPDGYGESRIVLLPRDPQMAYAYWDVPREHREEVRRQGGQRFALRFYDVTDIDLNQQNPHSLQQYDADEMARDWYIPVPVSDRDYIAEVGYVTGDGHWLMLARSLPVHIPPVYPSEWYEEHFLSVSWDEDLRGKTFMTLVPPHQKSQEGIPTQSFTLAQSRELQRIAGSIFGSGQQIPGSLFGSQQMVGEQAVSSYVFPSGVGMGAVPTISGMVSGLTMSGVGFSASAPPIRSRKFWLVADAELIVYGATEPDATVTIGGQPIPLNPDGTFRFQMSFQDGLIDYPIVAVASDGEQLRSIHMKFTRETPDRRTNTQEEAQDEPY
jgi:WD40 repeat protein